MLLATDVDSREQLRSDSARDRDPARGSLVRSGLSFLLSERVTWFTGPALGLRYQRQINLILEIRIWRLQVAAAIARALSCISGTELEVEALKTIAIFCGVGLLVSLLVASYGLDLSAGFF